MSQIYHALGLHMHQPPGNLNLLSDTARDTAALILRCYDRAVRYALKYPDIAKLHVGFSGVLLEQLQETKIIEQYRDLVDIPAMLARYREAQNIEFLGTGYHHPLFALLPPHDWARHIQTGYDVIKETFGRAPLGFYPPEMAFSMELIPLLVKTGYQYAVVNGEFIQPHGGGEADLFIPYKAYHEDSCIKVVAIDRGFSQAQAGGLDPVWFANEGRRRMAHSLNSNVPCLLTSWSSGENGDWFRNMDEGEGFFGHFFAPYMEHAEIGEFPIQPIAISEFLHVHPAQMSAHVQSGAWHSGSTFGYGLSDWSSSPEQREMVERLQQISSRHTELQASLKDPAAQTELNAIYELLLESQSSCFICWGDTWLDKLPPRLQAIEQRLNILDPSRQVAELKKDSSSIEKITPDFAMDKIEALKLADAQAKAAAQAEAQAQARAKALAETKAAAQAAIMQTLTGSVAPVALHPIKQTPAPAEPPPKQTEPKEPAKTMPKTKLETQPAASTEIAATTPASSSTKGTGRTSKTSTTKSKNSQARGTPRKKN